MDFWQTVRALVRRWYVAVPVFVAAVGIAGFAMYVTPHKYESTGTVVLTEPNPGAAHQDGSLGQKDVANPLMSFADSLSWDSELLIRSLNSPAAQQQIKADGGLTTFTASDGGLRGPYIIVTVDSTNPDGVVNTVSLAFDYATKQLLQREQALGAPASQYIVVKTIVSPTPVNELGGAKSRFAMAAGVLSLAASLCAVYAVETYTKRRRRALA